MRYHICMLGLMCEFWHNATVFEISYSFETILQSAILLKGLCVIASTSGHRRANLCVH